MKKLACVPTHGSDEQQNDFFFRLFRDGCANVEEIIMDGILKRNQLNDMVRGLYHLI